MDYAENRHLETLLTHELGIVRLCRRLPHRPSFGCSRRQLPSAASRRLRSPSTVGNCCRRPSATCRRSSLNRPVGSAAVGRVFPKLGLKHPGSWDTGPRNQPVRIPPYRTGLIWRNPGRLKPLGLNRFESSAGLLCTPGPHC